MKRVKVKTPTKTVIRYRREKPEIAKCAVCGKPLHGVPRKIPSEIRKLAKSKRRPTRPYGGYICSSCTRELFRERARSVR